MMHAEEAAGGVAGGPTVRPLPSSTYVDPPSTATISIATRVGVDGRIAKRAPPVILGGRSRNRPSGTQLLAGRVDMSIMNDENLTHDDLILLGLQVDLIVEAEKASTEPLAYEDIVLASVRFGDWTLHVAALGDHVQSVWIAPNGERKRVPRFDV